MAILLALTAVTFALGWAQKLPCRGHPVNVGDPFQFRRYCYTDVKGAWSFEGLDEGKIPYVDHPVEYPVLMGAMMGVVAGVSDSATQFFDRTSLLLLAGALVVTATTIALAGPSRRSDALLVALAPGAVMQGTVNWDFAAAALAGLAMLAWARRRPTLAGVVLGLGVAMKFYPILFLAPLLVLCARRRQWAAWARLAGATVVSAGACYAVGWAVAGTFPIGNDGRLHNGVLRFFIANRERAADFDSLWYVIQQLMRRLRGNAGWTFPVPTLNTLTTLTLAAGIAAVAVLLWKAPKTPRVASALFLVTALFLLTNKVYSPQYTIWLVPLAVLARPRWGPFLAWQALEVALVVFRWQFFLRMTAAPAGLPIGFFSATVVARDMALAYVMYTVAREILHPDEDVVRVAGDTEDPAGGVLNPAIAAA